MTTQELIILYFIYGLSFFTMGLSCLFQYYKHKDFLFKNSLLHLALFGLIHGVSEWLIMFNRNPLYSEYTNSLTQIILLLYGISFLFMAFFAINLLSSLRPYRQLLRVIILSIYGIWLTTVLYVLYQYDFNSLNIRDGLILFTRYITALPTGIFTSIILWIYQKELKKRSLNKLVILIKMLAMVIFLYTLSTGLVGEYFLFFPAQFINRDAFIERFNIPIEIFRIVFAISITMIMYVFMFLYEIILKVHNERLLKYQISRLEHRKLGSQLHDGVLQQLFIANLNLNQLEHNETSAVEIVRVQDSIQESINEIRAFLKSPIIQSVNIEELNIEIVNFLKSELNSRIKFNINFNVPSIYAQPIDIQALNNLMFIIKEFTYNMKKHSKANLINITCEGKSDGLSLILEENGKGFIKEEIDSKLHFGLQSIRNRVDVCKGIIKWDTKNKTKCSIFIPWEGLIYDSIINR